MVLLPFQSVKIWDKISLSLFYFPFRSQETTDSKSNSKCRDLQNLSVGERDIERESRYKSILPKVPNDP